MGLRGVEDLSPAALSGGMRKRVALARAVIPDLSNDTEKIVMYDEPTAGLDPVASTVVRAPALGWSATRARHHGSVSMRLWAGAVSCACTSAPARARPVSRACLPL